MTTQLKSRAGVAIGTPLEGLVLVGEFDGVLNGFAAPLPVTLSYWIVAGGIAILRAKTGVLATSTSTDLYLSPGAMPVALQPDGLSAQGLCTVLDNGVTRFGLCAVFGKQLGANAGRINFSIANLATGAVNGTNFTASGTKGLPTFAQIMYPVAAPFA